MKLQLLVPHWKETVEEISPLLDSIALQQGINFNDIEVIIAHDGPEATELKFTKLYPFVIKEVRPSVKIGVSAARNLALSFADADYVMFCDSDDMFYHSAGIYAIFDLIKQFNFDTLTSIFIEERKMEEGIVFIRHEMDSTFVHGKVYRRQYLLDNNIYFNNELTVHEDSYFVTLANEMTENKIYSKEQFYLWKWNEKSISRSDPEYILKTYPNLMKSFGALTDALAARGNQRSCLYAWYIVMFSYYWLNEPHWHLPQYKHYLDDAEKIVASITNKNENLWSVLTDEQKENVEKTVPKHDLGDIELPPFEEWFNRIRSIQD